MKRRRATCAALQQQVDLPHPSGVEHTSVSLCSHEAGDASRKVSKTARSTHTPGQRQTAVWRSAAKWACPERCTKGVDGSRACALTEEEAGGRQIVEGGNGREKARLSSRRRSCSLERLSEPGKMKARSNTFTSPAFRRALCICFILDLLCSPTSLLCSAPGSAPASLGTHE